MKKLYFLKPKKSSEKNGIISYVENISRNWLNRRQLDPHYLLCIQSNWYVVLDEAYEENLALTTYTQI